MTNTTTSGGTAPTGMMRKQHNLTIRTPLPRYLPPEEVVAALRTYVPIIKHQALVTRYERSTESPACASDPFFDHGSAIPYSGVGHGPPDARGNGAFVTFIAYERISLIPGIASKEINFPVTFQDAPDGVRCRADAPGGVMLWIEYRVKPKPQKLGDTPSAASSTAGPNWEDEVDRKREYELVERVTVETSSLLMPFVAHSMESAHREICQKVVDEVAVRFSWE